MSKKKTLGQVFTPLEIVERMLDSIGYSGATTLTHRLLEPSCGEGVFLVAAARRLIRHAQSQGLPAEETISVLSENITGIEYDNEALVKAQENLEALAVEFSLPPVPWNLLLSDALTYSPSQKYDFVVGNPPYIRLHNMPPALREQVKQFPSATGTTDLYIIFYELGLEWLNKDGTLAYITPNSWFKNLAQTKFREILIENKQIRKITNYGARAVFGSEAATYTSIVVLDKAGGNDSLSYTEDSRENWTREFPYTQLKKRAGQPFIFVDEKADTFLTYIQSLTTSLGEQCNIQNGVATLRDKIFLNAPSESESTVTFPVVKASTYKGGDIKSRIIFPYAATPNVGLKPLTEDQMRSLFPEAYKYLLDHKEELLKRDSDKSALWFHYGRSQGITSMLQPKLTFSHVVHPNQKTIQCFELPANSVVYSGLFATETDGGLSLDVIKGVIESEDFCKYVKLTGKDMSGGYKSFGVKNIKSFRM